MNDRRTRSFRAQIVDVGNIDSVGERTGMIVELEHASGTLTLLMDGEATRMAARRLYEYVTITVDFGEERTGE